MAPDGPAGKPQDERSGDRLTRRHFVASGVVLGAAVIWNNPFPFADNVIGASIAAAAGPTGPTGPDDTGGTGPEVPTGGTGTGTGTTGPAYPADPVVVAGLRDLNAIKVTRSQVSFSQRFVESGQASWVVDLGGWKEPTKAHNASLRSPVRLGTAKKKITGAGRVKVTVKLTKAGRALLRRHPDGKLVLRTTFTDPRGRKLPSTWLLHRH
jgi:hypothetical protein